MSKPDPPETIFIHWCPVCGRDDRYQPFTGKAHYFAGVKCGGQPVKVTYALRTASNQDSASEESNRE